MTGTTGNRLVGLALAAAVGLAAAAGAGAGEIDDARLLAADRDADSWLSFGRDYSNQRFSMLDEIDRSNVAGLVPAWVTATGVRGTFQATPLVADDVIYFSTPFNHVVAADAATGSELWRYQHERRDQRMCCGPSNRGLGMGYGRLFMATIDARLIALDQATGAMVWDIDMAVSDDAEIETLEALAADDPLRTGTVTGASGLGANMAPLVHDGLVIAGVTGAGYGLHIEAEGAEGAPVGAVVGFAGEFGRRGYVSAYDAATGAEVWRWYTTAEQGWEGEWRETTPDGEYLNRDIAAEQARSAEYRDAWRSGGGSIWLTPALDPELGLIYQGVGNPSPQMEGVSRPGDNLYTVSLVALDARTGKLRWHYQQVPHDMWGYDVASQPVLFELPRDAGMVKAVGQASKTGWFYVLDRVTGAFLYKSEAFVPQDNMFAPPTPEGVRIAPGAAGGASWSPVSFDPRTGLVYVTGLHMPMIYTARERPAQGDQPALSYTVTEVAEEEHWGTLSAIDTRAEGRIVWQQRLDTPQIGGVLATAGGLVFVGEGDGRFKAFDSANGELLWSWHTEAGANAPPIAYRAGGRQFVAVAAGGNHLFGYPSGDKLFAFALPR